MKKKEEIQVLNLIHKQTKYLFMIKLAKYSRNHLLILKSKVKMKKRKKYLKKTMEKRKRKWGEF